MPRIGCSITKNTAFRNSVQEFSNVYFYEGSGYPNATQAESIIDALTALEKTFHASTVTFVRGRLWKETGDKATSEMILQKNLSGNGARTSTSVDKERAWLFRLRAGIDSRGNPVYNRKWYHCCGEFVASQGVATAILNNTSGWSSAERSAQVAAMNGIGDAVGGQGLALKLCAKSGRLPTAGATWEAHPFLEHHQLGDMWRAQ